MKKIIFLTLLASTASFGDYSNNYQQGYKEGYTYNEGGIRSIDPIPPIAPIPKIGENQNDGYTRGILEGRKKKEDSGFQY